MYPYFRLLLEINELRDLRKFRGSRFLQLQSLSHSKNVLSILHPWSKIPNKDPNRPCRPTVVGFSLENFATVRVEVGHLSTDRTITWGTPRCGVLEKWCAERWFWWSWVRTSESRWFDSTVAEFRPSASTARRTSLQTRINMFRHVDTCSNSTAFDMFWRFDVGFRFAIQFVVHKSEQWSLSSTVRQSDDEHVELHIDPPTHTHTTILRLCGLCPGQPGWAGTRRYILPSSGFSGAKWR